MSQIRRLAEEADAQTMTASEMTSQAHDPPVAQLGKRGVRKEALAGLPP